MKSAEGADIGNVNGAMEAPKAESVHGDAMMAPPDKHELDAHMSTLIQAEKIKGDKHIMKHLAPHMVKHGKATKKILSLDELKKHVKSMGSQDSDGDYDGD